MSNYNVLFFSGPQLIVDSDDEDTPFEDSDNDDCHSDEDTIGQAHDMFSRIFRILIYKKNFYLPNTDYVTIFFIFSQMLKTEKKIPFLTNKEFVLFFSTEKYW